MSDEFMGVNIEGLSALGRVVVAAGRVEMVLAMIAGELGVPNPAGTTSAVMKHARRACRELLPPLDDLGPRIVEWMAELQPLIQVRHLAVHGVHMKTVTTSGEMKPIILVMRAGNTQVFDIAALNAAAEKLARLNTTGMELFGALRALGS